MGKRFVIATILGLALLGGKAAPCGEVVVGNEIFGNKEPASLVLQARQFDPMFSRQVDRDRAIALYERAIAIQPGARVNAFLANRVAQLYAHYADRGKGIRPNQEMAASWWKRCIKETDSTQFLWAEAHMGLGCAAFLSGRPWEAVEAFRAILSIDEERIRLPDWRVWPGGNAEHEASFLEKERARLRKNVERLKISAVDMMYYVSIRVDGAAAVSTLLTAARDHGTTPVAAHAIRLAQEALRSSSPSLYRSRGLLWACTDDLLGPAESPARKEAPEMPTGATTERLPSVYRHPGMSPQREHDSDAVHDPEWRAGSGQVLHVALAIGAVAVAVAVCVLVVKRRRFGRRAS